MFLWICGLLLRMLLLAHVSRRKALLGLSRDREAHACFADALACGDPSLDSATVRRYAAAFAAKRPRQESIAEAMGEIQVSRGLVFTLRPP